MTPVVAFVVLSIETCRTTTDCAVNDLGSRAAPKRARITPVVENPSSELRASWFGVRSSSGCMLSVPSVDPAKYRSVGYGNTPWSGLKSAAAAAWGVERSTAAGLALVDMGPTAPWLPEHALSNSAAATEAALI